MDRAWGGSSPQQAYLAAANIAPVNADLAQGILRNFLAVQKPDGWVDWKPGQPLLPTQESTLCPPLLARLAWTVFQYTEDDSFLRESLPKLVRFLQRWLQPDRDVDGDGLPEWQSEAQMGYVFLPTFAAWQTWGQGADIRTVESPDLLAYLVSEARSLHEIAHYLRDENTAQAIKPQLERLTAALESLWNTEAGRYTYRDRDTHSTQPGQTLFIEARGMEVIPVAAELQPANRILLRVKGGTDAQPNCTFILHGRDASGAAITEAIEGEALIWVRGHGVVTSNHVYSYLDQVTVERLSRVYSVDIQSVDTTREDLTHYLPLWSGGIPAGRAESLIARLTDPDLFWRAGGVPLCPATDPNYDPSNADGCGGSWPYWQTLIAEGLIEQGAIAQATDLCKRLLTAQTATLREHKAFREFYHAERPEGLGDRRLSGLPPLHLLLRVLGVRIISPTTVWTGGAFAWGSPVKIMQHDVIVERSAEQTVITFPSADPITISNEEMRQINAPVNPA
jgi:glycogen debranching enzyme